MDSNETDSYRVHRSSSQVLLRGLPSVLPFAAAALLILWANAPVGDLAGDPDEAAHAVTSLMVKDYLTDGLPQSPLAFANDYYTDFPKVALGHYPPVYYGVAGLALLVWPDPASLLSLQSLLFAGCMVLVLGLFRKISSLWVSVSACVFVAIAPLISDLCTWVMADFLLLGFCLASAWAWMRYLERPSWKWSLAFGGLASLALLTKGSALFLAFLPPLSTLLSGKLGEWKKVRFWLAAVPVVLTAGPWYWVATQITKEGMSDLTLSEFFPSALRFYSLELPREMGWIIPALAVGTLVVLVWRKVRGGELTNAESVGIAWLAGAWAVLLLVPAGVSHRYLLPILPVTAILAAAGGAWALRGFSYPIKVIATIALVFLTLWQNGGPEKKEIRGFGTAVEDALSSEKIPTQEKVRWLVSSDPRGEGAVIAAAAFALEDRAPSPLSVFRASKELSASDWMGRGYEAEFVDPKQIQKYLDKSQIETVFLDLSMPEKWHKPHHKLLQEALENFPDHWGDPLVQTIHRRRGETGQLLIYHRASDSSRNADTSKPAVP